MSNLNRIGCRVPSDLTETSLRGSVLSMFAMIAMGSVLVMETKAYFSSRLGVNLALHTSNADSRVQLNFDITMLDLPCDHAAVDIYSTVGHQKDIVKSIKRYPIDSDGVLQEYEQQAWHQNDIELWDPAVWESIDDLHEDGEDAIRLNNESFHYALKNFPMVLVNFYTTDCPSCDDLGPTYEALGEIVTDTAMSLVDDRNELNYSEEEYENRVNEVAPVLVTKLDCNEYPDVCDKQSVKVYPSIRIYFDGMVEGDYKGHRTVMELVHWVTQMEAEFSSESRMQSVVQFANERVVRTDEDADWNDEVSDRRAPSLSWNATQHPGCQITGNLMIDEAPGKFVIHAKSFGHSIAPHMTNLSHVVNHFSFGDMEDQQYYASHVPWLQRSLFPLDGHVYTTNELHQAYHHYMQVITTEIEESAIKKWARATIARVYKMKITSHLSSYRHFIVPEVQFSYDLSPIAVSYMQISRSSHEYLTSMLAILGGTFTVFGLMDSGISSLWQKKSSYYC